MTAKDHEIIDAVAMHFASGTNNIITLSLALEDVIKSHLALIEARERTALVSKGFGFRRA